jgi:tRNA A37 threonylcarbamoyladenosine modification protein TsaB
MLFINISSDKIHLADGHKEKILDRNGIENILGPILIDRQKTAPFTEIFLINGPGGFTNLRVGTLMLNTLNMFQKDILDRQKNQ